jgi:hypothetical protein
MAKPSRRRLENALARLEAVRGEIAALDLIAPGTLLRRTKVCGKPGCACARDPAARHGPYYEWGRMEQGARSTVTVPEAKARQLERALRNRRRLEGLLRRWMRESVRVIDWQIDVSADTGGP